ncbi:hypothetical protein N9O79_02525 [Luminiphilus sp.]|nr:hypothetical protein [Luminiphilus sp.]
MLRAALAVFLIVVTQPTFAELDTRIKVSIEEPVQGERYSGISNLRGWAVSPEGMGTYFLSIYVDDEFAFYLVPYGSRPDVAAAFPDYPDSDTAGFSMAYNYKDLSAGEHEIRVRAYDNDGNYNEAVTTFTAEKFVTSFIASDSAVDISTSERWRVIDKQTYLVSGPTLEGKQWDFLLKWDRASQSFKMEGIGPVGSGGSGSGTGGSTGNTWELYACVTSPAYTTSSSGNEVEMKNGLRARNNEGKRWETYDEHVVFKTESGRWYTIEEESAFYRLDVISEPTSCFEYLDYSFSSAVESRSSGKALVAGSNGEVIVFDSCGLTTEDPLTSYDTGFLVSEPYVVSLKTGESCVVLDAVRY